MMTALSISLQSEEHQNQQPSNTARTGPGLMKMVVSMMLSPGNLILSRTTLKGEYKNDVLWKNKRRISIQQK